MNEKQTTIDPLNFDGFLRQTIIKAVLRGLNKSVSFFLFDLNFEFSF